MIQVTRKLDSVSKLERCSKCSGVREWKIYENGCKEKTVWSLKGIKCKHKWQNKQNEEKSK